MGFRFRDLSILFWLISPRPSRLFLTLFWKFYTSLILPWCFPFFGKQLSFFFFCICQAPYVPYWDGKILDVSSIWWSFPNAKIWKSNLYVIKSLHPISFFWVNYTTSVKFVLCVLDPRTLFLPWLVNTASSASRSLLVEYLRLSVSSHLWYSL